MVSMESKKPDPSVYLVLKCSLEMNFVEVPKNCTYIGFGRRSSLLFKNFLPHKLINIVHKTSPGLVVKRGDS